MTSLMRGSSPYFCVKSSNEVIYLAVSAVYEEGIVKEQSATAFAPNDKLIRVEMAVMLVKAYHYIAGNSGMQEGAAISFADIEKLPAWSTESVKAARNLDLMPGIGAGQLKAAQKPRVEDFCAQA